MMQKLRFFDIFGGIKIMNRKRRKTWSSIQI